MTLMSEEQKGKMTLAEDGGHMTLFSPCPDQLLVLEGCSEHSLHPGVLVAIPALSPTSSFSQSSSSPAQALNLCKVLAYCLIFQSTTTPALPGTCRDLDAF